MKRTILMGLLAGALVLPGLMAQQKAQGPQPKSKGELEALQALFAAQGKPDEVITAGENVLTKYADTEFKDTVLFMEALAYQQKRDPDKMIVYAERAVAANPKHFQAELLLAEGTLQGTREHDLDRDEKLGRAEKYANEAIGSINTATKPNPQMTDQQWDEAKKDLTAQAHDALGMAALQRKSYDKAITEFKTAIEGAAHPEPAYEVRLASAYQGAGKHDEAIATAEKVMNEAETPAPIKQVAQSIRAGSVVAKGGGNKAPGQNAPPQVEIKKQ